MTSDLAINARYQYRRTTGVERYAQEISKRLTIPKRFISPNNPPGQLRGHLWEQFILPIRLRRNEILWSPANTGPWSISRQAATIHDASVFDRPEWFRSSFAAWTRLSWKILARNAKAIITVSNFSRKRLICHLRIPEENIHVIPNGVGKPFEIQSLVDIKRVHETYNINLPYFLFVGTHEPRKNLQNLISAWKQIKRKDLALLVAGGEGTVFAKMIFPVNEIDNIRWLGYIPEVDLPSLYAGAKAVVIPSFYEGFGLTALEAMACGASVISSNTTSFPETVGEAALQINPINVEEIKSAILQLVEDGPLTNTLRERGLQRAAQFTWDVSASQTQTLLESL